MKNLPKSVSVTITLILLNAVFWFVYAVITVLGGVHLTAVPMMVRWVMTIMAAGIALTLAGVAILLIRHNRFAFYFGLFMLTMITILSIVDQFGLLDLFSLLISLVPLVLLIRDRVWYLHPQHA